MVFIINNINLCNYLCRFRLKIGVRDESTEKVFTMFDDQVKKIAFHTYAVLAGVVSISFLRSLLSYCYLIDLLVQFSITFFLFYLVLFKVSGFFYVPN
jgi:hypothetical protein